MVLNPFELEWGQKSTISWKDIQRDNRSTYMRQLAVLKNLAIFPGKRRTSEEHLLFLLYSDLMICSNLIKFWLYRNVLSYFDNFEYFLSILVFFLSFLYACSSSITCICTFLYHFISAFIVIRNTASSFVKKDFGIVIFQWVLWNLLNFVKLGFYSIFIWRKPCVFVQYDRLILDTYDSGHIKYEWVKESGLKIMDKTMAQFELTSYHTEKIEHKYLAGIMWIGRHLAVLWM